MNCSELQLSVTLERKSSALPVISSQQDREREKTKDVACCTAFRASLLFLLFVIA